MAQYQSDCSATASLSYWFGGCQQHKSTNSIMVYYPTLTPTPVPQIGPASNLSNCNSGGCDCSYSFDTVAAGSVWQSAFFTDEEYWLNSSSNQDMLTIQTFQSGSMQNYTNCNNYGFKNVAAKRQWHGCYAWTSPDGCSTYYSNIASADQTKYTTCTITASFSSLDIYLPTGTETITATIGGYVMVNPNTGIITNGLSSTQTTTDTIKGITYYTNNGAGYTSDGTTTSSFNSGGSTLVDSCFADVHCGNVIAGGLTDLVTGGITITTLDSIIDYWNNYSISIYSASLGTCTQSIATMSAITNANSYSATGYLNQSYTNGDNFGNMYQQFNNTQMYVSWTKSGTSYSWTYGHITSNNSSYDPYGGVTYTYPSTGSGTLSLTNTNSAASILGDCEGALLSTWDMSDNQVYPWRTDNYTSFAPLVTRREVQANVIPLQYGFIPATIDNKLSPNSSSIAPTGYNQMAWQDPNQFYFVFDSGGSAIGTGSAHYDGTIIGNPLAYGNYDIPPTPPYTGSTAYGWMDFYFNDIRFCQCVEEGCDYTWKGFTYEYGATLADSIVSVSGMASGPQFSLLLPQGCTHWTNNLQAHSLSRGAQRSCAIAGGDGSIWSVKWAETRIPVPHYNYFRPCGSDRVLIEETTAQCFVDSVLDMNAAITGLSGGATVLIYGTSADGIYTGCSQAPNGEYYQLATGSLISALPSDYTHPLSSLYSNGFAGIVRFPDAWSICGETAITLSFSGSNTLVTFLQPQTNLRTGDCIDLWNQSSSVLSSQSVVRISDTQFIFTGSFTGSAYYAMSSGAPSSSWNDTSQKYEGRYNNWFTSYRNSTFNYSGSCNQFCLNFTPCREQAIFLSPNSESVANTKTVWFTDGFTADGVYGSISNLNAEFGMTDMLFQTPLDPANCNVDNTGMTPDIGLCLATTPDDTKAYYYIPQVEAVCSVPYGSPALPSGSAIPVMVQPSLAGVVGSSFTFINEPWNIFANQNANCPCVLFNYPSC